MNKPTHSFWDPSSIGTVRILGDCNPLEHTHYASARTGKVVMDETICDQLNQFPKSVALPLVDDNGIPTGTRIVFREETYNRLVNMLT